LANKAKRGIADQEYFIELEKSPEYKGKISITVKLDFVCIEKEENLPKKLRRKSNTPSRCDISEGRKSQDVSIDYSLKSPINKLKRSTTPTPTASKQNNLSMVFNFPIKLNYFLNLFKLDIHELQTSKTREFEFESDEFQTEKALYPKKKEIEVRSVNIPQNFEPEKSEEKINNGESLGTTQEKRRATFGINIEDKNQQKLLRGDDITVYLNKSRRFKKINLIFIFEKKKKTSLEKMISVFI
jgi:hypothetical protein